MAKPFIRKHLTSFRIIIFGFAAVILAGSLLLMLPISSQSGDVTPFNQTLFTATSAVCVTGLVLQDTATHWSIFGQIIILIMIQSGGLGVISVAASFVLLSGRRTSLKQRSTMQEAIAGPNVGSIVELTGFAIKMTLVFELAGFVAMTPVFCIDYGPRGIWLALFHSISAFCNAGFDLMGQPDAKFASLTVYQAQPVINIVIMLLIVIGGLGFFTWKDISVHKHHVKRYRMQTKVVLVTSAILIFAPAVFYFFVEYGDLPIGERILSALFQSVTPRTAGFNTSDLTALTGAGRTIMIVLMLIGGSPGSTAGGMKTTTVAVLFATAVSVFRRKEDAHFFGRRFDSTPIKNGVTIFALYAFLFLCGGIAISMIEGLPMGDCLFETASAVGTVGLSLGLTPGLGIASQIILMILMFLGRVGGLTLFYAAFGGNNQKVSKLPLERITVG